MQIYFPYLMGAFLNAFEKGVITKAPVDHWFWSNFQLAERYQVAVVQLVNVRHLDCQRLDQWIQEILLCHEGSAAVIRQFWKQNNEESCVGHESFEIHLLLVGHQDELTEWFDLFEHMDLLAIWTNYTDIMNSEIELRWFKKRVHDLLSGQSEFYRLHGWQLLDQQIKDRYSELERQKMPCATD